jgi:hypothetical protein
MEERGLLNVKLPLAPWSDSYWPTYKGATAVRYADPSFPHSKNWGRNHAFVLTHPASSIYRRGVGEEINRLSPTEKYDLAMGDHSFSLTRYAWAQGEKYFRNSGVVPGWYGYCHGWSAAAHMLAPYPENPVDVQAADGGIIRFYPQDIKGLTSMLWANAHVPTRFMGNRCNGNPRKNAYGRVVSPDCFDTNPGSWHLALVNQLGIHARSLVMDSSLDYQVWNYPVAAYRYRYFHPLTWEEQSTVVAARVSLPKFKIDRFREFRSPRAKYIVGVVMEVTFSAAVQPSQHRADAVHLQTLRFIYDLELDENNAILGGEWYSNAHPDFVWTFDREAQAKSVTDGLAFTHGWKVSSVVPADWQGLARRASRRGQPLQAFLSGLLPR